MARTHRSSSASAFDNDGIPRNFGKTTLQEANKVKKNGSGKYNWGSVYDDIDDADATSEFNFAHSRRRSNSSSVSAGVTKISGPFDDDVFEEEEDY